MVWCFPRRYSIFHGLGGRNAQWQYRHGERRIWLFGIWFPTVFVLFEYYKFALTVHPRGRRAVWMRYWHLAIHRGAAPDHELWSELHRLASGELHLRPLESLGI